MCDPNHKVVL